MLVKGATDVKLMGIDMRYVHTEKTINFIQLVSTPWQNDLHSQY